MQGKPNYLRQLENESIYIMREVIAECENPAMLYSIGKDSAVMLHLMRKAFYPQLPPIPIVHVDTKWKFKEMIDFRDKIAKDLGLNLIVYINPEGESIDIWQYIYYENIEIPSLYYAKKRKVVEYMGQKILADDERIPKDILNTAKEEIVRFRTLGCYPLTGAIDSSAKDTLDIINELLQTSTSERYGRLIDSDQPSSMEKKKQQGYF